MYDSDRDERGFWRREISWLRTRLNRLRAGLMRGRAWLARAIGRRLK